MMLIFQGGVCAIGWIHKGHVRVINFDRTSWHTVFRVVAVMWARDQLSTPILDDINQAVWQLVRSNRWQHAS